MAFAGYGDSFEAPRAPRPAGAFWRWITDLIIGRPTQSDTRQSGLVDEMPRKLAGPDPKDPRAKGYLADLDIEVGF